MRWEAVGKVWVHWVMWNVMTSTYDEADKFYHHSTEEASTTYLWQLLHDCLPNPTTIIIPEGSGMASSRKGTTSNYG